ncbi:MAG: hypothetical protein J7M12_01440 [Candidatus Hydrogenedentes bacterium]|nr:hypothetical protein [Candidatus Hydrogenedentota bacterium]
MEARALDEHVYNKTATVSDQDQPCVHGLLLDERITSVHTEIAEVRRRLERLETVLTRGMAVLLANLTGIVLMLAREFLSR